MHDPLEDNASDDEQESEGDDDEIPEKLQRTFRCLSIISLLLKTTTQVPAILRHDNRDCVQSHSVRLAGPGQRRTEWIDINYSTCDSE